MTISDFHGFKQLNFTFNGRNAVLVEPNCEKNGKWLLKTEYFGAFPELEIAMLSRGYSLAYLKNRSRWGTDDDQDAKRDFADYLHSEYGLAEKCICIGMSCGGFHAVNFASRYPEYVSFLYLDAPLLSMRGWTVGAGKIHQAVWQPEQLAAYGFSTACDIITYNDNPINRLKTLTDNNLPVALVYGAKDLTVDPDLNARTLEEYYKLTGTPIKVWEKPDADHHPHVDIDVNPVIEYIEANAL